jgi:hypothetical protein
MFLPALLVFLGKLLSFEDQGPRSLPVLSLSKPIPAPGSCSCILGFNGDFQIAAVQGPPLPRSLWAGLPPPRVEGRGQSTCVLNKW